MKRRQWSQLGRGRAKRRYKPQERQRQEFRVTDD